METATIIGLIAAALTTAALVPQLIKTMRIKETKDISFLTYLSLTIGTSLWLVYGIMIKNLPVIAANIAATCLSAAILFLKLKYK